MSTSHTGMSLPPLLHGFDAAPQMSPTPQKPAIAAEPTPSIPLDSIPKKPMRPLTAYHIFFQIEREFIIQTTAGEDADKSIHDNKVYLSDVPLRYKNIRLTTDWYLGPGKRQKRKHRKQHGKIGFLELSRVISSRWAQLEEIDPETKSFVKRIAKQELDEYYLEMKMYKELVKDLPADIVAKAARPTPKKKRPKKSINNLPLPMKQLPTTMMPHEMLLSSYQASNFPTLPPASSTVQLNINNDIDHFLRHFENSTKRLVPSLSDHHQVQAPRKRMFHHQDSDPFSLSSFDPSEAMDHADKPSTNQFMNTRCTSPAPAGMNPSADDVSPTSVDRTVDIRDDEILQLWKSQNY